MLKQLSIACVAALAFCAEAGPITFTNVQFDVDAIALADASSATDSQSSPPTATPIVASASVVGSINVATAGALADDGLLSTSADVSGSGSAIGSSHFSGSFVLGVAESSLSLDFFSLDVFDGSGSAMTTLFVLLKSGSATLFQDFITGPWTFDLAAGTPNLLDVTLVSEVSAGPPLPDVGTASAFGLVTIASTSSTSVTVPEPASLMLIALALAILGSIRHRRI